jgi:hypothetical protein
MTSIAKLSAYRKLLGCREPYAFEHTINEAWQAKHEQGSQVGERGELSTKVWSDGKKSLVIIQIKDEPQIIARG